MTMVSMNSYLEDKGFIVHRAYVPKRSEYRFDITKNGITKTYYWKYDNKAKDFTQYQKESMDSMIRDFNEKATVDKIFNADPYTLLGSIDEGYTYRQAPIDYTRYCINDVINTIILYENKETMMNKTPSIKDVIFNDPATIVFWSDNTKTVVKATNEGFDPEKGLAMAIAKKFFGNKGNYYNNLKKWLD